MTTLLVKLATAAGDPSTDRDARDDRGDRGERDGTGGVLPDAVELAARYQLPFAQPEWLPDVIARYNLTPLPG